MLGVDGAGRRRERGQHVGGGDGEQRGVGVVGEALAVTPEDVLAALPSPAAPNIVGTPGGRPRS